MAKRFEGLGQLGLSRGSSRSNDALRMTARTERQRRNTEILSGAQNDELCGWGLLMMGVALFQDSEFFSRAGAQTYLRDKGNGTEHGGGC